MDWSSRAGQGRGRSRFCWLRDRVWDTRTRNGRGECMAMLDIPSTEVMCVVVGLDNLLEVFVGVIETANELMNGLMNELMIQLQPPCSSNPI